MQKNKPDLSGQKIRSVFLIGFLLTVALALTGYIDSSFLGTKVNVKTVGLLFSLGSIASIVFLTYLPEILKKIGIRGVFHLTGLTYLVSVLGMLNTETPLVFGILFIFYIASGYGMYFAIDLLIESMSKKKTTGVTRGIYLAIYNLAYLLGPLLAGMILKDNSFNLVYLIAGVFVIIMFLVFIKDLEKLDIETSHRKISPPEIINRLFRSENLFNIFIVSLMLSFFFSWMAIYTPIYLHTFLGFNWQQIGTMFAIMHIPYITLEVPIGRLADKYNCEKYLLTIGLVIIGLSTAGLSLFADGSFWAWTLGLAITRVGASFVQVGHESYFFKRVDAQDSHMIALYRNASPLAYILGPIIGTIVLAFTNYNALFIVLGVIMLGVTYFSVRLKKFR